MWVGVAGEAERRRARWQTWVLVVLLVGNTGFPAVSNSSTASAQMLVQLPGWNDQKTGYMLSVNMAGYVSGSLLLGMGGVADRLGGVTTLVFSLAICGACNIVVGLLTSTWWILAVWGLNSFVWGISVSGVSIVITNWYESKRLPLVWGTLNASWYASAFLFPFILGILIDDGVLGWRGVFFSQGGWGILMAIFTFALLREEPQEDSLRPHQSLATKDVTDVTDVSEDTSLIKGIKSDEPFSLNAENTKVPDIEKFGSYEAKNRDSPLNVDALEIDPVAEICRDVQSLDQKDCLMYFSTSCHFWLIILAYALCTIQYNIVFWIPTFAYDRYSVTPGRADQIASLFNLGSFLVLVTVGLIFDRLSWRSSFIVTAILCISSVLCMIAMSVYISTSAENVTPLYIWSFVYGFTMSLPYNVVPYIYPVKYGGPRYNSMMAGLFEAVGNVASVLLNLVYGAVVTSSPNFLIYSVALFSLLSTVLLLWYLTLERPRRRKAL